MELPKRKSPRIPGYDYSANGAYFITVCTHNKKPLFGSVGADSISARMIKRTFLETIQKYDNVKAPIYAVMPNHVHLLLQIHADDGGRAMLAPTISVVVQQMKGYVTKKIGASIWQKLFHDHVIRGEKDYLKIWNYIEGNPSRGKRIAFM